MSETKTSDQYWLSDEALAQIPHHMHDALLRYINQGISGGSFLTAVMENDLVKSFGCADEHNRAALFEWTYLIYNDLPHSCHGSPKIVRDWIERGGLNGDQS